MAVTSTPKHARQVRDDATHARHFVGQEHNLHTQRQKSWSTTAAPNTMHPQHHSSPQHHGATHLAAGLCRHGSEQVHVTLTNHVLHSSRRKPQHRVGEARGAHARGQQQAKGKQRTLV